jgi:hypothetical protein
MKATRPRKLTKKMTWACALRVLHNQKLREFRPPTRIARIAEFWDEELLTYVARMSREGTNLEFRCGQLLGVFKRKVE